MPQSMLIGRLASSDHTGDYCNAVNGKVGNIWVRVRVTGESWGDVNKWCEDQLSTVLFLYDKQVFIGGDRWERRGRIAVILEVVKPALAVNSLVATGLARIDRRRSSCCFCRRRCRRVLGADVHFERDGLYGGVVAECTAVRLLSGVAHAMTPQRVMVAG